MEQLVERLLLTPEICGLNPVISKIYMYYQLYWKDENERKKRPGIAQFKKLFFILYSSLACNVPTCLPTYLKHPSLMCTIVIDDCARHKCHHMWITLDTFSKWWMPKVFSTKDVIGEWTQPLTYLCSPLLDSF